MTDRKKGSSLSQGEVQQIEEQNLEAVTGGNISGIIYQASKHNDKLTDAWWNDHSHIDRDKEPPKWILGVDQNENLYRKEVASIYPKTPAPTTYTGPKLKRN